MGKKSANAIYSVSAGKSGLDKCRRVSSMHEQVHTVLGLNLEVLIPTA